MKIEHDGRTFDFEMDSCEAHEIRMVEQHTGMTFTEWQQGLGRGKVDALVALVFLAKRRAGLEVEWADLDNLKVQDLMEAMAEANGLDLDAVERGEVDVEAIAQDQIAQARQNRADRRAARKGSGSGNGAATKRPVARKAVAGK